MDFLTTSEGKIPSTDEIREVEKEGLESEFACHGKTGPIEAWVGSGKGTVRFVPGYDPAGPAFDPDDWEN
jgi:hypothetical protein